MALLQLHGLVSRATKPQKTDTAHQVVPCGPLNALVSPFPSPQAFEELSPDEVAVWALKHHEVLSAYCAGSAVLPMTVGAVFSSETAVQAKVAAQADHYVQSLVSLANVREYTLKLHINGPPPRPQPQPTDGRGFLQSRRQQRDDRGQLGATQRAMAKDILDELRPHTIQINPAGSAKSGQLINCAMLLDETSVTGLRSIAQTWDEPCKSAGLDLVISGPWPPYSFDATTFPTQELCHAN